MKQNKTTKKHTQHHVAHKKTGGEHTGNKHTDGKAYRKWPIILALAIAAITAVVYIPAINNDFVNWDDDWYVIENEQLRYHGSGGIGQIFTEFYHGQYSPVSTLALYVNYAVSELNPLTYHITCVAIHLANVVLVFWLIWLLVAHGQTYSKSRYVLIIPAGVALLFGVHTLQVESVAWVSAIKVVLYTLFFLASLIGYVLYLHSGKKRYIPLSLLLFALSFGAKEQAMVLPVVLVAIDFFKGRSLLSRKVIIEKIPFFVLAIVFGVVSLLSQANYGAISDSVWYSFASRIAFAGYSVIEYFRLLIFPSSLSAFYPYPTPIGTSAPVSYWAFVVVALGIVAAFVYSFKYGRSILFGGLFFAVNVFLTLQLVSTGREVIVADRYAYIPSIGFFFILAYGLHYLWQHQKPARILASLVFAFYVGYLSVFSFIRADVWSDGITMWTDVQNKYPTVHVAFYNRGNALAAIGKHEEAVADFDKAVPLKPTHVGTYSNRGVSLANLGRIPDALADFNKVVELDSLYSNVYSNRGNVHILLGNLPRALQDYNYAIQLDSSYMDAFFNRGIVRDSLGDYSGAIADWTVVVAKSPDFANAYVNRGMAYLKTNNPAKAQQDFAKVLQLNPQIIEQYYEYGQNNERIAKYADALGYYDKIIAMSPTNAKAYFRRAGIFDNLEQYSKALADFDQAIKIAPQSNEYYISRGVCKGKMGNLPAAIVDFDKAITIKPDAPDAYSNRGLAKMRSGDSRGAIQDYSKSIELNPKFAMAYNNRALARQNMNDAQGAINDFTKVIELEKNFAEAYYYRARLLRGRNQNEQACEDYRQALALGMKSVQAEVEAYCQ